MIGNKNAAVCLTFVPTRRPLDPGIMQGLEIPAVVCDENVSLIGCIGEMIGIPRADPSLAGSRA